MNDSFAHNSRSELVEATVCGREYEYTYDNIGNRQFAQEDNKAVMYDTNTLNQYSNIAENGAEAFAPQFDADGNQTHIKTSTGIWTAVYNAENRPVTFTDNDTETDVECRYDSMGRRTYKKVTTNGIVTLHQRYIYRDYLQIACIDLTRDNHPSLWFITWDPTQTLSTRPLAIQIDGTWHSYGWDLTKNICELYGTNGYISNTYTYSPFGHVTSSGFINQPIQWSSEVWDNELSLVNYNYRQYNPSHGVWLSVDPIGLASGHYNLYSFVNNSFSGIDFLGLKYIEEKLCLYPTSGKIGTVNARFNIETRQMEVETEKWIMPSWYNWLTSKENTGQRSWRAATEEELRIYFTLDDDNVLSVERDPSVLLARAYKEISNTIKINEQVILGNIILDLSTMGLKFPTSYGRLVHYTSPKCCKMIKEERLLRGKGGIFTTTNESACSLEKVALLGISAKQSETIHIPSTAYKYFHEVHPIGLYSFSKYLGGTRYAAPGKLNLDTGVFSQTGSIIKPLIYLYSIDIVVNIFVMYLY